MNHAKPFALHYKTDASPSLDGSAFFFCSQSFSSELHWRQPIIQEREEEFKRSLLELWKWDCFLLAEICIHLRASQGLRNNFPFQTSSAGCTWMSHKGAICVKVICFDGKCLWLTISTISLLPSFHFFYFLGDHPDRECSFLHGASFLSICSFWQWLFLIIVSWFHSFSHSSMPFLSPFSRYIFSFFSCSIAAVHPSFLPVATEGHPCFCSVFVVFEL